MALVEGLGSAKTPSWLGILRVWSLQDPEEEGTSGVDAKSTRNVRVEAGGTQVAGHVGLHALGSFADRLGLGETLSAAVGWTGRGTPVHDRSKVLTQAMLMLAGGGDSCADIETLASQGRLFGEVSSDTTLYWTFTDTLDADAVDRARQAVAAIRDRVWAQSSATCGDGPVILDVDASLVEIHFREQGGHRGALQGWFRVPPDVLFR